MTIAFDFFRDYRLKSTKKSTKYLFSLSLCLSKIETLLILHRLLFQSQWGYCTLTIAGVVVVVATEFNCSL